MEPKGTVVVPWDRIEVDGIAQARPRDLRVGAIVRRIGLAAPLGAPEAVLRPGAPKGATELRARAARAVEKLTAWAAAEMGGAAPDELAIDDGMAAIAGRGVVLSDGRRIWPAALIETARGAALCFEGSPPPEGGDVTVVRSTISAARPAAARGQAGGGVICFAAGTWIDTPGGRRRVEELRPGDRVEARDGGPADIVWTGARRMSGARLHAMPWLRPIRIRAGALGTGEPTEDLLVSPSHRLLVRGERARRLWGEPELLIRAEDLLGLPGIDRDAERREVTYVHIMTERHELVRANGVASETFHPADADLAALTDEQRAAMAALGGRLLDEPETYGEAARRRASGAEAAIVLG
ncbi:MAG: Hint domain-containing protein [Hasllibacter sp.]